MCLLMFWVNNVASSSILILSPNSTLIELEDDLLLNVFVGNAIGDFVGDRKVRNFLGELVGDFKPTELMDSFFLTPFIDIAAIYTHT